MAIQRYIRKPTPAGNEHVLAVRYEPGQPLDELRTVARKAGAEAEVTEVVFGSGKRVLLAWHMDYPDAHPAEPKYVTVEAGGYLAFSGGHGYLYETDADDLRHFYDIAQ